MPSVSKAQQAAMSIAEHQPEKATGAAKEMAKSMSKSKLHDFAATKTKGLPEHVKSSCDLTKLSHVDLAYLEGFVKQCEELNLDPETILKKVADSEDVIPSMGKGLAIGTTGGVIASALHGHNEMSRAARKATQAMINKGHTAEEAAASVKAIAPSVRRAMIRTNINRVGIPIGLVTGAVGAGVGAMKHHHKKASHVDLLKDLFMKAGEKDEGDKKPGMVKRVAGGAVRGLAAGGATGATLGAMSSGSMARIAMEHSKANLQEKLKFILGHALAGGAMGGVAGSGMGAIMGGVNGATR